MLRLTKHTKALNLIVRDERLSPNRRLLGEMLALWVDSQDPEEKRILLRLIEAQYGSPIKTLWLEGDDPNRSKKVTDAELEATAKLKDFFAAVQEQARDSVEE